MDEPAPRLGLLDGFESHQTPTAADYANVIQHGCVAMDANVLLNLYRYNPQARADLLNVLRALGNRLFLPHQAVAEFWRNREAAITDPDSSALRAREQLTKSRDQAIAAVRTWATRVALADERLQELVDEVETAFEHKAMDRLPPEAVVVAVFAHDAIPSTASSAVYEARSGDAGPHRAVSFVGGAAARDDPSSGPSAAAPRDWHDARSPWLSVGTSGVDRHRVGERRVRCPGTVCGFPVPASPYRSCRRIAEAPSRRSINIGATATASPHDATRFVKARRSTFPVSVLGSSGWMTILAGAF